MFRTENSINHSIPCFIESEQVFSFCVENLWIFPKSKTHYHLVVISIWSNILSYIYSKVTVINLAKYRYFISHILYKHSIQYYMYIVFFNHAVLFLVLCFHVYSSFIPNKVRSYWFTLYKLNTEKLYVNCYLIGNSYLINAYKNLSLVWHIILFKNLVPFLFIDLFCCLNV